MSFFKRAIQKVKSFFSNDDVPPPSAAAEVLRDLPQERDIQDVASRGLLKINKLILRGISVQERKNRELREAKAA